MKFIICVPFKTIVFNKKHRKMKTLKIAVCLMIISSFIGCTKNSLNDFEPTSTEPDLSELQVEPNKAYSSVFYIDNKLSNEPSFNYQKSINEDFLVLITVKFDISTKITTLQHHGYTTEEGYIEYGENNNLKLKEELQFANHMSAYAEQTGAIEEYEKTGKISESYLAYQEAYYQKVFQQAPSKIAFVLWDQMLAGDHVGVPYFWMLATLGSMNDRTSCIQNAGTGASITLFDGTFFRTRLATYPFMPMMWVGLTSDKTNRTESVITF
jgi:hypothetical protein